LCNLTIEFENNFVRVWLKFIMLKITELSSKKKDWNNFEVFPLFYHSHHNYNLKNCKKWNKKEKLFLYKWLDIDLSSFVESMNL